MLNKNKKVLLLVFILLLLAGSIFYFVKESQKRKLTRIKAARAVGELSVEPETLSAPAAVGSTFNVGVVVNVGDARHVNIASVNLTFDQAKIAVGQCIPGDDFQTIAGTQGCSFDNNNGTIQIRVQSRNLPGPTNAPIFANISFRALARGTAQVSITPNQIVVQEADGSSANFPITASYGGSYVIGAVTLPPPTNTPVPSPTIAPTPTAIPTAGETRLRLSPTSGTYTAGQSFSVLIYLDTGRYNDVSVVDAAVFYDKNVLRANSVNGSDLFSAYEKTPSLSGIDETGILGKIKISGLADPNIGNNLISGNNLLFAAINFQALKEASSTDVYFDFQEAGVRNDSNIGSYSLNEDDVLEQVVNASYQILPSSAVTPTVHFKVRFQGVLSKRPDKAVRVTVAGGPNDVELVYNNIPVISDEFGIWSGSVAVNAAAGGGYIILIKGPVHLARKYCDAVPTPDTEYTDYHCGSIGRINLVDGNNNLDFSNTLIYVGDLPPQDGVMNARDGSEMRLNLSKTDPDALSRADVNFDGIVNTTDYSLLIQSMQVRYDEER